MMVREIIGSVSVVPTGSSSSHEIDASRFSDIELWPLESGEDEEILKGNTQILRQVRFEEEGVRLLVRVTLSINGVSGISILAGGCLIECATLDFGEVIQ